MARRFRSRDRSRDPASSQACINRGCDLVLTKPLSTTRLRTILDGYWTGN